jgi:hypothetical protein
MIRESRIIMGVAIAAALVQLVVAWRLPSSRAARVATVVLGAGYVALALVCGVDGLRHREARAMLGYAVACVVVSVPMLFVFARDQ